MLNALPSLKENMCVPEELDLFICVLRNHGLECGADVVGEKRVTVTKPKAEE